MKIQCTINEPQIDGYFWASLQNEKLKENFYKCWEYCMEAQCTEFYAPSILDVFTTAEIEQLIPKWAALVGPGSKITLGGTDLYVISKSALKRTKDLGTINDVIFLKNFNIKSLTSAESTRKFLETLGFKINDINIDYNSCAYTVEAIKSATI